MKTITEINEIEVLYPKIIMSKKEFINTINDLYSYIKVDIELSLKHLKALHLAFPTDENGFSEIHHYVFDNNFGKPSKESEYETPEMFYDRLI